ncbi:MAG TPA: hypothetical protein VJ044_09050 [Candidatus Hodarchaeales archaeon]|nr:hypothetical protein [Candidatus Hodarchaeales archaeon]
MFPKPEDVQIIKEYRLWSEDFYAAGFIDPEENIVRSFRKWRKEEGNYRMLTDYEEEFLEEFYRQEREEENE